MEDTPVDATPEPDPARLPSQLIDSFVEDPDRVADAVRRALTDDRATLEVPRVPIPRRRPGTWRPR